MGELSGLVEAVQQNCNIAGARIGAGRRTSCWQRPGPGPGPGRRAHTRWTPPRDPRRWRSRGDSGGVIPASAGIQSAVEQGQPGFPLARE